MNLIKEIHVSSSQSSFISPPTKVLTLIREVGDTKINIPFKIESSDQIIGFFTLNFFCPIAVQADPLYFGGKKDCRLETFMIDERWQKQGFGKAAIREIREFLAKNHPQIKGLKLSVNFLNEGAKLFYKKCGFKDTGKVYEGGPAGPQHIYRLDLT